MFSPWMLLAALLSPPTGAPPATTAQEEKILSATIDQLRAMVPDHRVVHFRRTYLMKSIGMDQHEHLVVCGQVDMDDPRAAFGWVVFGSVDIGSRVMVLMGNRGWGSPVAVCSPGPSNTWDYDRDFSARFEREITATTTG